MKITTKIALTAALLGTTAAHAQGRWYVFNVGQDRCFAAREYAQQTGWPIESPEVFASAVRRGGSIATTQVERDNAGAITIAIVKKGNGDELAFFTSEEMCFKFKAIGDAKGMFTPPDELR